MSLSSRLRSSFRSPPLRSRRRSTLLSPVASAIERLEDRHLLSAVIGNPTIDLSQLQIDPSEYSSTHIIVRFKEGTGPPAGVRGVELMADSNLWKIQLGRGVGVANAEARVANAITAFSRRADVLYAQPDYIVSFQAVPWYETDDTSDDPIDDHLYQNQDLWGLSNDATTGGIPDADIDAPQAWNAAMQDSGEVGGMDVTVAVLDTGIDYTHADLYLNIWINQGEIPTQLRSQLTDTDSDGLITFRDLNDTANAAFVADGNANGYIDGGDLRVDANWFDTIDQDGNGYLNDLFGWDFHNNDNNPMDDHFHGTHVAGTIGAIANNNWDTDGTRYESRGVTGVAWEVSLMGLKFLDAAGRGYTSSAILALDYAISQGVEISNNSWGGAPFDQALLDAIQRAANAGHLFVAAAGNGDWLGRPLNNDVTPHYPSNFDVSSILAVAATNSSDRFAWFSNYGATTVDLAAPGMGIWSTVPLNKDFDGTLDGLTPLDGTSMAAPHVTGTAVLMLAANPNLTALEIKQILMDTTDDIDSETFGRPTVTNGRLNAGRAVAEAIRRSGPDTTPPDVAVAAPNGSETWSAGDVHTITWTATDNLGVSSVDIFYSVNGGQSYKMIAVGETNDGRFTWTVPNTPSTSVFVKVFAHDAIGNTAVDISDAAFTIAVPDADAPAAPTGLTAVAGNGQVLLNWNDNSETDFETYYVYRSATSGSGYARIATVTASAFTDTGVAAGQTYYYVVAAVDSSSNESSRSDEVSATLMAATTIHVGDIDVSSDFTRASGAEWEAYSTVRIVNESGNPVAGATVTAEWRWGPNGFVSGVTDSDGIVSFSSGELGPDEYLIYFTVTSVSHATLAYDFTANTDPDADSDGTNAFVLSPLFGQSYGSRAASSSDNAESASISPAAAATKRANLPEPPIEEEETTPGSFNDEQFRRGNTPPLGAILDEDSPELLLTGLGEILDELLTI